MCKTKMSTRASQPSRRSQPSTSSLSTTSKARFPANSNTSTSASYILGSSTSTTVDTASVSSNLRETLFETTTSIYDFSDVRNATNNFLMKRYSTNSWRCVLHGKDVVVFQRKIRPRFTSDDVKHKLSVISKSHSSSIVKLLGISISSSSHHVYLVYEYVRGSDLRSCLHSKHNPGFTILSTWMSRMQIATDVAHGLDYIHNTAGLSVDMVHKYVTSSGIIVTEPNFNAKICHFGAAELCGDTERDAGGQFQGVLGYMSPEFKSTGVASQKSDVYAFGVVVLELLSGVEALRHRFDGAGGRVVTVVEAAPAREAVKEDGGLRWWVDRRLKDSFPVDVAQRLTRVALQCVEEDPEKRPDMKWVAGKVSKLYLDSKVWADRVKVPSEISVSLGPR